MVRKYIVDSVNYWADEYHIDGFRFDLVSLIDTDTINEVIRTVHQKHINVLFYGEGWDMGTYLTKSDIKLTTMANAHLVPGFGFFNDQMRDSVRGSVFDENTRGFVSGASGYKDSITQCFLGAPDWADNPCQVINYISCHDNHTLHDRIAVCLPHASEEEIARRNCLAAAINLLSQGVPFFQAGEEMLRSKVNRSGKFEQNSYRSPDKVNSIKWSTLDEPHVMATSRYYQGLIALRKAFPQLRLTTRKAIMESIHVIPVEDSNTLVFMAYGKDNRLLIAFNGNMSPVPLNLPRGRWSVLVKDQTAGIVSFDEISGDTMIPPVSALVFLQDRESSR